MGKEIGKMLKHFLPLIIVTAVAAAAFITFYVIASRKAAAAADNWYASPNTERVYGDRRVFDFADQLTDEEEQELAEYIYKAEQLTCCDIVIVTLNESLANYEPAYRANYSIPVTPDKYVMVYADKFWEDNRFGYDAPQMLDGTTNTGDGVILVDNLFREPETGKIYTWMGTTGIVEDTFSDYMIDSTLDAFYERIDYNYLGACKDFVDKFSSYMVTDSYVRVPTLAGHYLPFIVGALILLFYFLKNRKQKAAEVTTTNETYIVGNQPTFVRNEDIFLRKSVTKRYNPPSSSSGGSSGGGGHHSSGGGGSHGGGGHSR